MWPMLRFDPRLPRRWCAAAPRAAAPRRGRPAARRDCTAPPARQMPVPRARQSSLILSTPLTRAPAPPRPRAARWHKWQHVYVWAVYPLMHLAFQLGDFASLLTNKTVGAELLGATKLGARPRCVAPAPHVRARACTWWPAGLGGGGG